MRDCVCRVLSRVARTHNMSAAANTDGRAANCSGDSGGARSKNRRKPPRDADLSVAIAADQSRLERKLRTLEVGKGAGWARRSGCRAAWRKRPRAAENEYPQPQASHALMPRPPAFHDKRTPTQQRARTKSEYVEWRDRDRTLSTTEIGHTIVRLVLTGRTVKPKSRLRPSHTASSVTNTTYSVVRHSTRSTRRNVSTAAAISRQCTRGTERVATNVPTSRSRRTRRGARR